MAKTVTISDVAAAAEVSIGTVSRYINGLPVRNPEPIREAVERLGYVRNALAGSIRTQSTRTIGILVPNFEEFHARIIARIAAQLRQAGYQAVIADYSDTDNSLFDAVGFLTSHRVDAIVVGNVAADPAALEPVRKAGLPLVFYNDCPPGWEADTIMVRNRDASARAVRHLIDIGHRRIGIVTGRLEHTPASERLRGYHDALDAAGLQAEDSLQETGRWNRHDGYAAAERLIQSDAPPTAIFSCNYQMSIGVLEYLREAGLRVPEDISLLSFDDVDLFALLPPGISVVAQPLAEIAAETAQRILARLAAPRPEEPRRIQLNCEIVLRGSTRPPG